MVCADVRYQAPHKNRAQLGRAPIAAVRLKSTISPAIDQQSSAVVAGFAAILAIVELLLAARVAIIVRKSEGAGW